MALIIENQTEITKPLFMEWRKSNRSASYYKTIGIFTLIMIVILGGAFAWFTSQGVAPVMMIGEFLFMFAIFLWVVFVLPHSRNKSQYKALCKAANGTPKRTVRFYTDYFSVTTESGNIREFSYGKVHTMKETEHLYVLVNESNIDIILDKNGFQFGTIEQVKKYLPATCDIITL